MLSTGRIHPRLPPQPAGAGGGRVAGSGELWPSSPAPATCSHTPLYHIKSKDVLFPLSCGVLSQASLNLRLLITSQVIFIVWFYFTKKKKNSNEMYMIYIYRVSERRAALHY